MLNTLYSHEYDVSRHGAEGQHELGKAALTRLEEYISNDREVGGKARAGVDTDDPADAFAMRIE